MNNPGSNRPTDGWVAATITKCIAEWIKDPTLRWPCVASTGRPSFSQVRLGGGTPLETHSRLMGWLRTTERSAGPVVRMDGGTRKRIEKMHRSAPHYGFGKSLQVRELYLPHRWASQWLALKIIKMRLPQLQRKEKKKIPTLHSNGGNLIFYRGRPRWSPSRGLLPR